MSLTVPRTCTELGAADEDRLRERDSRPLASYRDEQAYVLLGDPGAGKTTAFKTECEALGADALSITARDFATFDPDDHPKWEGKTLFIDGLDEVRVGAVDARTPFDKIRAHLAKLGKPRFRLSCRHADWLGRNDRRNLVSVSPQDSQVTVLGLDPLSETQVAQIVDARTRIGDVNEFIRKARETGIADLLENPQTLLLLADVMAGKGTWPTSRLDLFDRACALMIEETNEEHSIALHQPPTPELLNAAGRLCAVLLVSGAVGYVRGQRHACDDYLKPEQCEYPYPDLLERALSTKLFTAEQEGRFIPVHRHVAEFLAAKHVASTVAQGLPARRVIALLTGEDGGVVTYHRGVSAWLAALCTDTRPDLIERDPIGVVSYGDVREFTTELKERLLHSLSREGTRLTSAVWNPSTIGAVATPGMESALRKILESRAEQAPTFVAFVLFALAHGDPLRPLAECLIEIVNEQDAWPQYATMALKAFIHNCSDPNVVDSRVKELLANIAGGLQDWQDELTAVALGHLYPTHIPPTRIWDHLTESRGHHAPSYERFWRTHLVDLSTDDAIAELLDGLASRRQALESALKSRHLEALPVQLLARGLEAWGDRVDSRRRLKWLGVDLFRESPRTSQDARRRIRAWLGAHPQAQREIIQNFVDKTGQLLISQTLLRQLIYDSRPPLDFGPWCLGRARSARDARTAEAYLRLAMNHGVSHRLLMQHGRENPPLQGVMKQMLVCHLPPGFYDDVRQRQSYIAEAKRRRRDFVSVVRAEATSLRENRCERKLLAELAGAYFGLSSDVGGANPGERINRLFGDETDLTDAVFAGLRGAPFRERIPATRDLIASAVSGKELLVLPVLAGVDELDDLRQLSNNQLRRALVFHFLSSTENSQNRQRRLLDVNPTTAAEVMAQCVAARMRAGDYDDLFAHLLNKNQYSPIAGDTALHLLDSFPIRETQPKAMSMLIYLLVAALRYTDRAVVLSLIERKLSRTSMSTTQRMLWLGGGVIAGSEQLFRLLKEFIWRRESRVSELAIFLAIAGNLLREVPTRILVWFIQKIAGTIARWRLTDSGTYWFPFGPSRCVDTMVRVLAERSDPETSTVLERLSGDNRLHDWRDSLSNARDHQAVIRRDAEYRHPMATDVCTTLNGGTPANAGDLAALLIDRLLELGRGIRDANTDDWRQYWNVDQYGKPLHPRPENVCREALLSDLKRLLPENVTARREGSYANDNRADIVVGCGSFEVPVEIKRNGHRDLWSAAHDQLIAKYARDPATGGYGIYLVFWLGQDDTQPPPTGPPPAGPRELQARVEGSLSDAERRKISVVVLDVSRPA